MPKLSKKIHDFCTWVSSAVLYVWPVLTLITLAGAVSNQDWVGREIVLVASIGSFVLFIVGCIALTFATLRRPQDKDKLRPLVVLYQAMFVPTAMAYAFLILMLLSLCFGIDILPNKYLYEGDLSHVCGDLVRGT